MKTLTLRLNSGTDHQEEDYGPPIPHSLELWNFWGCYEHERCLPLHTPGRDDTRHWPVEEFYQEHIKMCKNSPGCRYFVHWLVGEFERPGGGELWK